MKQLVLEENQVKEILNYLDELPRKYGNNLYVTLANQFNEQNPEQPKVEEVN